MKTVILLVLIRYTYGIQDDSNDTQIDRFPDYFQFGVSSAAYQVEGGWDAKGKGESIWDHFTHLNPSPILDKSTGDIACDSYNRYMEDIDIISELGVDFYRFSISWTRILPTGFAYYINPHGISYYNNLIDELLARNITPMVTLYHWDLPQTLQNLGGWTNPLIVDYFEDYARVVFEAFGDRVKNWTTINEPILICDISLDTDASYAPDYNIPGIANYICGHYVILAHARAWHLYDKTFRPTQKGRVGITVYSPWFEPETNSPEDKDIVERTIQFTMGWQANPIFSKTGDYPKIMKEVVHNRSIEQNFKKSRLPEFTKDEIEYIKGTSDFLGLNFYTSDLTGSTRNMPKSMTPSKDNDIGYTQYKNESWPKGATEWFSSNPPGFRKMLNWIRVQYNNPEVLITENGFPTTEGLIDKDRITYTNEHLQQLLYAIKDGCNITAYTSWTMMDNFEWAYGYTVRFGLYEVDFNDPERTRTPRASAYVYRNIVKTRTIDFGFMPNMTVNRGSEMISNRFLSKILCVFICIYFYVN